MPPVSPFRRVRTSVSEYRRARPAALNFEDLLRPQVEYLYRLAWRFTGSVADAEDLVQDVLIKLFPRTQELLEIEKLRPWLARVLYNQFVDSVRRQARSPIVELATTAEGDDSAMGWDDLLEGGLDALRGKWVEEPLERCPDCRHRHEQARGVLKGVRKLSPPAMHPGFIDQTLSRATRPAAGGARSKWRP